MPRFCIKHDYSKCDLPKHDKFEADYIMIWSYSSSAPTNFLFSFLKLYTQHIEVQIRFVEKFHALIKIYAIEEIYEMKKGKPVFVCV